MTALIKLQILTGKQLRLFRYVRLAKSCIRSSLAWNNLVQHIIWIYDYYFQYFPDDETDIFIIDYKYIYFY